MHRWGYIGTATATAAFRGVTLAPLLMMMMLMWLLLLLYQNRHNRSCVPRCCGRGQHGYIGCCHRRHSCPACVAVVGVAIRPLVVMVTAVIVVVTVTVTMIVVVRVMDATTAVTTTAHHVLDA